MSWLHNVHGVTACVVPEATADDNSEPGMNPIATSVERLLLLHDTFHRRQHS